MDVNALLALLLLAALAPPGAGEPPQLPSAPSAAAAPQVGGRLRAEAPPAAAEHVAVLATVRVQGSAFDLLRYLGAAGVLVESHEAQAHSRMGTVFAVRGRASSRAAADRLSALAARDDRIQLLFLAFATIPDAGDGRPVPLQILAWSPVLYPSRASVLTRGPAAGMRYYLSPRTSEILESSYDGKEFRSAFQAAGPPPFVEGGAGMDVTRMFWRARVESWADRQEALRRKGWEKYGWIFQDPTQEATAGEPLP